VRLVATGVCHTDAVVRDGWIPTTFPIVLGHEGAGIVEAVGQTVTDIAPGDHVVLTVASCGVCRNCRSGHPSYCLDSYAQNFAGGRGFGTDTSLTDADGHEINSHFFGQSSFATHVNAARRSVVKVRDDVPLELLGPLGCGVQTGAGAVLNVLRPGPGDSIAVFGTGAVGMSAILAAVASRATTIIAIDLNDARLALAKELGATHTINGGSEDALARIQEITGGGVRLALDTTANGRVFSQMIEALAPAGHAGAVGASAPGTLGTIDLSTTLGRGVTISFILEGDSVPHLFIPELIELWQAGAFPFDRLVKQYPFAEINAAFEDSERGDTLKPVVVF
jgi:aryl-alcohol dehydrogenase